MSRNVAGFPAESTSFVDRRHELSEAKRLLATTRLVTLTGPSGVGKTRLATRTAHSVARAFPDGVHLVPLDALRDGRLVPYAVADVLAIRGGTGESPMEAILAHLRARRLLLMLDNCEHLLDACADLVKAMLTAAESVRVLATSRHRLGVTGEHLLDVPPLRTPDPGAAPATARAVAEFPALTLFADRAAAVDPDFEITVANVETVARLCHRLDGLPLAIELSAARLRALSVEQLDARLDDLYRLGADGPAAPRHRTLRAAVAWSHDLCTPAEQRAWARLSVFPGSFDLDAATAICGEDAFDAVVGLVDKSVLVRDHADGAARYRLLTVLREYGQEKLTPEQRIETGRRHRDHYLRLGQDGHRRWFSPHQAELMRHMRAEHDNLRAALEFCRTTPGEAEAGLRLLESLWFYWIGGQWTEAVYWSRRLHESAGARAPAAGRTRWAAGAMAAIRSRIGAILVAGAPSRPAVPEDRLPPIGRLAEMIADGPGDADPELTFHVLSRVEVALTFTTWGWPRRAVPVCAEALVVCEQYGEQWTRSHVLCALALAEWALGDVESAAGHAEDCLRLEYVTQDRLATGWTLELLALIDADRGAPRQAATLRGAAQRIWYETGGNDPFAVHERAGRTRIAERLARAALGDDAFEQAYRQGYDLGPRDADGGGTAPAARPDVPLTAREFQVAQLIARGLTNQQIAATLVISRRTAESHVEHILTKLSLANRSQVAAWMAGQER
ncbi:ATP-binding protein [Actinoplanes subtropicus]|uniref:ATP-binding protein n=1 Tax=Actinoplanes subtropicus TaxID=543632 RepID=UPI000558982A|nr:LuxR C-terminal-related transcriptional regulator [Actinoplanes subtropicus]